MNLILFSFPRPVWGSSWRMLWNWFPSRYVSNHSEQVLSMSQNEKINATGLARSQTESEWLWVVAVHEPTAETGESCDLQSTRAHPRHHHVAPRGAWGHHWARWPPLHGLCQGVWRSEENLAHVQKYHDLHLFVGEKTAPGGEEEGVGCHPGWLKSGLWHWREGLWQIAESTLVCFQHMISFLIMSTNFDSRFYLTPSEGYKQGHTSGAPRQHYYHWSQKKVALEICHLESCLDCMGIVNLWIVHILPLPSCVSFFHHSVTSICVKWLQSWSRSNCSDMQHLGYLSLCYIRDQEGEKKLSNMVEEYKAMYLIRFQIMCPSREVRLPPLPISYFHQVAHSVHCSSFGTQIFTRWYKISTRFYLYNFHKVLHNFHQMVHNVHHVAGVSICHFAASWATIKN